jgi:hypothetical protein
MLIALIIAFCCIAVFLNECNSFAMRGKIVNIPRHRALHAISTQFENDLNLLYKRKLSIDSFIRYIIINHSIGGLFELHSRLGMQSILAEDVLSAIRNTAQDAQAGLERDSPKYLGSSLGKRFVLAVPPMSRQVAVGNDRSIIMDCINADSLQGVGNHKRAPDMLYYKVKITRSYERYRRELDNYEVLVATSNASFCLVLSIWLRDVLVSGWNSRKH